MFKKTAAILSTILFALLILSVSVLRSAQIYYAFYGEEKAPNEISLVLGEETGPKVDYVLPYPGKILPDNSLWFFKAARDRLWLTLTSSGSKRAELLLLFADKRLEASKSLFVKQKPEIAFSTLTKGEKYLELAARALEENTTKGIDTSEFAIKLAKAALKHREVIDEIKMIAPEDARPKISEVESYAENTYKRARDVLRSRGKDAPESPFGWD